MSPQSKPPPYGHEFSFAEMLAEPIVQAMMKSDGVTKGELITLIASAGYPISSPCLPETSDRMAVWHRRSRSE